MLIKQSDRVREIVRSEYVAKALQQGQTTFSVSARDVLRRAEEDANFPRARTPLICTVLQSKKLLEENGLEIEKIEGPPSRQSRRVVVHYRVVSGGGEPGAPAAASAAHSGETPEAWAERVTAPILGLMKNKIAEHGGAEGYLRWVRGYDEAGA